MFYFFSLFPPILFYLNFRVNSSGPSKLLRFASDFL